MIMSGGHHVNACFDQMLCLCDGAGDHDRQIPNQLLSLQRSPTPAVMSILPVGPPPCFRRAVSRALAHDSLESLGEFLSRFFDPLGETVRGPTGDRGGSTCSRTPTGLQVQRTVLLSSPRLLGEHNSCLRRDYEYDRHRSTHTHTRRARSTHAHTQTAPARPHTTKRTAPPNRPLTAPMSAQPSDQSSPPPSRLAA